MVANSKEKTNHVDSHLERLSKEELTELVLSQVEEIQKLKAEIKEFRSLVLDDEDEEKDLNAPPEPTQSDSSQIKPASTEPLPENSEPLKPKTFTVVEEVHTKNKASLGDAKYLVFVDQDLKGLIPTFLEERNKQYKVLEQAARKKDWRTLKLSCHFAQSATLTFGFFELSKVIRQIEQAALQHDERLANKWIFEFSFFLEQCQIKYEG